LKNQIDVNCPRRGKTGGGPRRVGTILAMEPTRRGPPSVLTLTRSFTFISVLQIID